jgi:hypothetical protein
LSKDISLTSIALGIKIDALSKQFKVLSALNADAGIPSQHSMFETLWTIFES